MACTSHWCDTKISLFARLIDHNLMMTVILTLLTRLSSLQIRMNNADLIFSMLDNIQTKEWLVHWTVALEFHTKPSVKDTLESKMYRRVRFQSCGTLGYGSTMWAESRQRGDILYGLGSKTCQRITCQLCWNNSGTKGGERIEPFSCSLKRGGPIGKVLVHRRLPECYPQ